MVTAVAGNCPVRKIVLSGDIDQLKRALYFVIEKQIAEIHADNVKGKPVNDFIMIASGFGFNVREHACFGCNLKIINEFYDYKL